MGECRDYTLEEMLSDPIVQMLMQADGIDPQEFESNLRAVEREPDGREAAALEPTQAT
jgi:hypothetical protein